MTLLSDVEIRYKQKRIASYIIIAWCVACLIIATGAAIAGYKSNMILVVFLTGYVILNVASLIITGWKKSEVRSFFLTIWDLVVLVAYIKFYIMCLITYALVCVLALYVLSEAGTDISGIGKGLTYSIWIYFSFIVIIAIDKCIKNGWKK